MSDFVIETMGLTKWFGGKCAVDQVDLRVPRGTVCGFLGRNGSGKTTTIRMLMGLLEPTRGACRVLGSDSRHLTPQLRGRIGYLGEGHRIYGWMTVEEAGKFQAAFYEKQWNWDLYWGVVKHFNLEKTAQGKHLSRGERAGLALALTLAPEPELLVLDDPALGLDPVARRELLEVMLLAARDGERTVFFSSHLLSDVERVADHLAVLDRSVLRVSCRVDYFRERAKRLVLTFAGPPPRVIDVPGTVELLREEGEVRLTVVNWEEGGEAQRAVAALSAAKVKEVPLSLEDALISYLGDRIEKGSLKELVGGAV